MVAGHGRGGSQVGRDGRSTERSGSSTAPPAGEKTEAKKVKSDATRIRGSYRPPSPSASRSGTAAPPPLPTALVVKTEDAEPEPEPPRLPHFAPGDYLDDEQFKLLLPHLGVNAGLASGEFVAERELDIVLGLVAHSSQQDADKPAEWRHIFVDLVKEKE